MSAPRATRCPRTYTTAASFSLSRITRTSAALMILQSQRTKQAKRQRQHPQKQALVDRAPRPGSGQNPFPLSHWRETIPQGQRRRGLSLRRKPTSRASMSEQLNRLGYVERVKGRNRWRSTMDIKDAKVLLIATVGVEQVELTTPRDKLREAGATV